MIVLIVRCIFFFLFLALCSWETRLAACLESLTAFSLLQEIHFTCDTKLEETSKENEYKLS